VGLTLLEAGGRAIMARKRQALFFCPFLQDVMNGYDPDLMWSLKPNLDIEGIVHTNALGLRNGPVGAKDERVRILAVGDSTTYGSGAADAETWPARLQQALDDRAPGRLEVINAGVPGYSAYQGLRYLETRGLDLEPDVVIACFGHNECTPVPPNAIADLEWENPERGWGIVHLIESAAKGAGLMYRNPLGTRQSRMTRGEFLDTLEQLSAVCLDRDAWLILLLWPFRHEVEAGELMAPSSLIPEAARVTGTPVFDLTPLFRAHANDLYTDAVHITPEGNTLVAEYIAAELLARHEQSKR